MSEQPKWKCIGHIGDADPIAYGGGFVYVDETGVYPPEMTWFEPLDDRTWDKLRGDTPVEVYRLVLEPPRFKTLRGGQWDTSKPENMVWHREWFAKADRIKSVAESCGRSPFGLLRQLASKDPLTRAKAYQDMIGYHGVYEHDQEPVKMTEDQAYEKYKEEMKLWTGK